MEENSKNQNDKHINRAEHSNPMSKFDETNKERPKELKKKSSSRPSIRKTTQGGAKKKTETNTVNLGLNYYKKRKGTAGLSGQLYKTKLLSLILLRVLDNDNIQDFLLGTNVEGMGLFDDIVLRYELNNIPKPKMICLQAKHRDDLTRELSIADIINQHGDFGFPKYFESYLKIRQKFVTENDTLMFRGSIKDIDCDFIIYTPATENLPKINIKYCQEESIIKTNKNGKMFQLKFEHEDVDVLMHNVAKTRAIMLAKCLTKFILKDNNNYSKMLLDDLIKTYHVFLVQNVIKAEYVTAGDREPILNEDDDSYFMGKFRQSFLSSNECYLMVMKNVIYKELVDIKGITYEQNEVENIMKSIVFKLPIKFGNQRFHFSGHENIQDKTLIDLCFILKKLLDTCQSTDSTYFVVNIDEDSIGPGKVLQTRDLENYKLGDLIGNLLIMDDESEMLKFNFDKLGLSKDNIEILKFLQGLDENYDLKKYRFNVNIHTLPRLSLIHKEHDRNLLVDFLGNLKFYTNQAKEEEVENILKKHIDRWSIIQQKPNESLIRIKCDAIFLKVHDKIQKWWQQPDSASYLTKDCNFYDVAKSEILDSPFLDITHFIYREKIKHILVEFGNEAIHLLCLNEFLKSDNKIMFIFSDEINFSCIKVMQFFREITNENNYLILDLEFVILESCLDIIKSELVHLTTPTLIIIIRRYDNVDGLHLKLKYIIEQFKGKLLIIADKNLENNLYTIHFNNILHIDNNNNFNSLSIKTRNMILHERKVIFQGKQVTLGTVLNDCSLNILSSNWLSKIIINNNNNSVVIGKSIISDFYSESNSYYINRTITRWIRLTSSIYTDSNFCIFENEVPDVIKSLEGIEDVVVVTVSKDTFEWFCAKYKNKNVHWCSRDISTRLSWEKSQGSLKNIIKHIERGSRWTDNLQPKTLMDMHDKIVILNAEPGEGKSTLFTHVATYTKHIYPEYWILKINLIEHINQFSNWKENETKIDLIEAMYFLYSTIDVIDLNYHDIKQLIIINDTNEIYLNNDDDKSSCDVDLSIIKLFNYFYNNNKLAVVFDGFDEICPDYVKEVLLLLNILKTSRLEYLWVSTRPYHVLDQLEVGLGTFSFNLIPFNKLEQKIFLRNIWSSRLNLDQTFDIDEIHWYVNNFLSVIASLLLDDNNLFTGYPLHLLMIAEMYQDIFRDFIMCRHKPSHELSQEFIKKITEVSNLTKMYEQFTNMKFYKIRFAEKNQSVNIKHPDTRIMIEKERKEFVDYHQKASAYFLLNRKVMLSQQDLDDVYVFFDTVKSGEEKTGIVESISDKYPIFTHFTFAEYYAVEFIFNRLRSGVCTSTLWKYLIKDILINKKGIQRFINSKLQNDCIMADIILNKQHMDTVCTILNQESTEYFRTIYVAIDNSYEYIALFLLESIKIIANEHNLIKFIKLINTKYVKYCIFCTAVATNATYIVKYLIKFVTDIDSDKLINLFNCQDSWKCNPMLVIRDDQNAQFIFKILQNHPDSMLELLTSDLQWYKYESLYTVFNRFQIFCRRYLLPSLSLEQRVKIFSLKNIDGKLPVHFAAKENDYEFFVALNEILSQEEFKKMCTTSDNSGLTPVSMFSYDELSYEKFKNLLEMIYDDLNLDIVNLKFNALAKPPSKSITLESAWPLTLLPHTRFIAKNKKTS